MLKDSKIDHAGQAHIAVNRFGLGARGNEAADARHDPQEWLLSQLVNPEFNATLGDMQSGYAALREYKRQKKQAKADEAAGKTAMKTRRNAVRTFVDPLLIDALHHAVTTPTGFQMRLFDFFSNHFSVSAVNKDMQVLAPLLEREAIAPNLFGHYEDLVIAVEQHPAMLVYLNNDKSVGPDSRLGRKKRGLNENLAREILELHTLGVDGGYDLADIQELAMAISGWSIVRKNQAESAGYQYRASGHQPGVRSILDQHYAQKGQKQGEAVLRDLARHPATAQFISFKLAQHLLSDKPPAMLVADMATTWANTRGNIEAVVTTLIQHESAWQPERRKLKSPREYLVSTLRLCGAERLITRRTFAELKQMGQSPFDAGSPAGYSALNDAWSGSDALMKRIDWAAKYSERMDGDPLEIADQAFGGSISETTYQSVKRAESRSQGLALLLLSPEFQSR